MVLLHGFTSSGDAWARWGWIDRLAERGFAATLVDLPGHGSGPPASPANTTTAKLASYVLAILDGIGANVACVVGFSMGGGVALELALRAPKRVRRLVVAGVGDAGVNGWHDESQIAELRDALSGRPVAGSMGERIRRNAEAAGNDPRGLVHFLDHGGWPGGLRRLGPLEVPTLVVVAERDEYMPTAERLLAELAPTEILRVPGSHHEILGSSRVQDAAVAFLGQARMA